MPDFAQVPSTSYRANNVILGKGQAFTKYEYKKIMNMLNKDVQDIKQVTMIGITTWLLAEVFAQDWIVDSGVSYYITIKKLLSKSYELANSSKD